MCIRDSATYFIVFTATTITFHILHVYIDPVGELTKPQRIAYSLTYVPKFCYEFAVLVIFICLSRSFNALSADYQANARSQ